MAFSDIFKSKELKARVESLEVENTNLKEMLTPEMCDVLQIKKAIDLLNDQKFDIENQLKDCMTKLQATKDELTKKKNEILINDEIIELEEFSFYKPRYTFVNSDEYKSALDQIRSQQKVMIKEGTAASGSTTWTVNHNAVQGRKMVQDMIKLCLRSFNNECDAAVLTVKFNNYDRYEKRIIKSYDTIVKLGVIMQVAISSKYKDLKIQELQLALEYQIKKQEEKEELKELRAQQREAVRLAKEIEDARKAAYKEQAHFLKAYEDITKQIAECVDETAKMNLLDKQKELKAHLDEVENNLKAIDYREANQRAGYVYVISNIGSFGKDIYKIGMTRRLDPMDRIDELSDASVPFNFDVHAMIFSKDAPTLEAALHRAFEQRKVNMINQRREFFHITLDEIKEIVKRNHDKTVEFIENPEAEQYRETLKLLHLSGKELN